MIHLALALWVCFAVSLCVALDPLAERILSNALKDGIDLKMFNFTAPALDEIVSWSRFQQHNNLSSTLVDAAPDARTVDVHGARGLYVLRHAQIAVSSGHHVPNWYRSIAPVAGQNPTPEVHCFLSGNYKTH